MSSQIPVYLAELSPARIRGRVVGIQQWAIEWGILIMYLVSYGCSKVEGPASFRIAWGVQAVPALILLGALCFFPESPRWLASKDRWEQCLDVLTLLHGHGEGDDRGREDPVVQAEYLEGLLPGFLGWRRLCEVVDANPEQCRKLSVSLMKARICRSWVSSDDPCGDGQRLVYLLSSGSSSWVGM